MDDTQQQYVVVPPERLAADVYQRVLEEYVNREGTDYGFTELSLEAKCSRLKSQVETGEALILFDFETSSCTLLSADEYARLLPKEDGTDG